MVVTQHWDGCLLLYPQPEYQKFEAQLLAKGSLNNQVRDIQRFFLGKARDADMDRQGRLLLPANLRTFAGWVIVPCSVWAICSRYGTRPPSRPATPIPPPRSPGMRQR